MAVHRPCRISGHHRRERLYGRCAAEFPSPPRRHVGTDDQDALRIELLGEEAIKTSEIEGEILNRASVQSSLRHQFGLGPDEPHIPPAERGIATMMIDLYQHFDVPLTDEVMFGWHRMILNGDKSLKVVGGCRTGGDPMQVVSGPIHDPTVHFEAPAAKAMRKEMRRFNAWFNASLGSGLPALTRAGLAHLYFECIHPFEDGNGRVGRALAEKSLAQNLSHPSLIALAYTIERKRKDYYAALERNNREMEITDWLDYFARTVIEAQDNTIKRVEFYVGKTKFYDRLRDQLNERQAKAVARMFKEGIFGFKGGLSATNYISITGATRATATRDLQGMVEKGALTKTGELAPHAILPRPLREAV